MCITVFVFSLYLMHNESVYCRFLQALLDRVAPAFVDSLLADYKAWAEGELDDIDVSSERENDSPGRGSGHMQA